MSDIAEPTAALPDLAAALAEAECPLSAAEAEAVIDGVLAAPPPLAPEAWIGLIAPQAPENLRRALLDAHRRLADARASADAPDAAQRLSALRAALQQRQLDGFIVPRSDEHQGEYVSMHADRLAWLTGFTGSAGLCVVTQAAAAVFVDGRYTLQAETEVDGALYQRRHVTDQPATEWIGENMVAGAVLGYDPWLMTPIQLARYQDACDKAGVALRAADGNPLDAVWADQPPPPLTPVEPLADAHNGEASTAKRRRMGKQLADENADAVVLTAPDSIAWLFNMRGGDVPFTPFALSFAILHADASAEWFIDARKLTADARAALGDDIEVRAPGDLGPALDALGHEKKTVRADPATAAVWIHDRLTSAGATAQRGDDPCQLAKACKNAQQMDGMRAAHHRDAIAMVRFLAWLDATANSGADGALTEIGAADRLEALRRESDMFRGLSFPTISGAGPNGAIVHYRVTPETDRALEPGNLYLVDSGAQYPDGTTDITRTVAIGQPSDDMRRHFTLVLKGHIQLARAVFPKSTTGSQLDVLARQALWQAGLDYDHGTGHGVGSFLSVHEGPQRISKLPSRIALQPGMVISNEPGFYLTGGYGIRIENLVAVVAAPGRAGEAGFLAFETLTLAPIDRALIERDLLDADETAWLDAYHAEVRERLADDVDPVSRDWLIAATKPLGPLGPLG